MKTRYIHRATTLPHTTGSLVRIFGLTVLMVLSFVPHHQAFAQVEGSVSFPGGAGNYISIPDNPTLDITGAITVEAWINISSSVLGGAIVCKGSGGGGEAYCLDLGAGALGTACARFYVRNTSTIGICGHQTVINANTWYHLAGVYNGSTVTLYINGVATNAPNTYNGGILTNDHIVSIGSRQSGSGTYDFYVQGMIDEVRIWNIARTSAEINNSMYCQIAANSSGLVAYYRLNEGSGTIAADAAGGDNNGTLTGSPAWSISTPLNITVPLILATGPFCNGGSTTLTVAGSALSLNGTNQYASTPDLTSSFTTTSMTVELWFNAKSQGVILDERGQANGTGGWQDSQIEAVGAGATGTVKVNVWNASGTATAISIGTITYGTWNHAVVRYDGTKLDGFLNGVVSISGTFARSKPTSQFWTIGEGDVTNLGSGGLYFNGLVDEMRIWNSARTNAQVTAAWNKTVPANSPNLVAYYKMDEGSGISLADASGNGMTATLFNSPAWVNPSAYSWSPGGATTQSLSASSAGAYTVAVSYGSCYGTSAPYTVTALPMPAPQAIGNITVGPVCSANGTALLPDANITASSIAGAGHESWRGRLFNVGPGGALAWACGSTFTGSWWQVDLGSVKPVNGVATQIRGDFPWNNQRVASYNVQYSNDGINWNTVAGSPFAGNTTDEDYTVVTHLFSAVYQARYIRIYPLSWGAYCSMRADVISIPCAPAQVTASAELSSYGNPSCASGINWYDAAAGGTLLGTGQYITRTISSNMTIYAEAVNGAFVSATRTAVTLQVNAPTAIVSGRSNISCYAGNNGSITITAGGSTSPYQFSINNGTNYFSGSSPYTFSGLTAGTYYPRVKDANGCESPSCP
jgi:hypothetical protein